MSITSKSDAAGSAGAGMHRHEEGLQSYAALFLIFLLITFPPVDNRASSDLCIQLSFTFMALRVCNIKRNRLKYVVPIPQFLS